MTEVIKTISKTPLQQVNNLKLTAKVFLKKLGCGKIFTEFSEQNFNKSDLSPSNPITTAYKQMASHSSILAWEIPRTEEPGGLTVHGVTKSQT